MIDPEQQLTATRQLGDCLSVLMTEQATWIISRNGIYELKPMAREIPYNVHLDRSEANATR